MEDKTSLLEKEVTCLEISDGEISGMLKNREFLTDEKKTLNLENESAAKLFSIFGLDFSYCQPLMQSSPSCRGSAYSLCPREKPFRASGFDIAFQRAVNPLGSFYDLLRGNRSSYYCSLPCDIGAMGSFGRM